MSAPLKPKFFIVMPDAVVDGPVPVGLEDAGIDIDIDIDIDVEATGVPEPPAFVVLAAELQAASGRQRTSRDAKAVYGFMSALTLGRRLRFNPTP
ncbi:MAG: hypothetical protein M3O28_13285 [Actinomycetota bacterium]|nr:hypothetical protein [Actinomycetota bacterium]